MTSTPDRHRLVSLVEDSVLQGARPAAACAELGMSRRTLQRWKGPEGSIRDDRRPLADRPTPANKLSEAERDRIVATCASPEFASREALWPVHRTGHSGQA